MSSATLPQASAGAALLGRAVLVPLDDSWPPVLQKDLSPRVFPSTSKRRGRRFRFRPGVPSNDCVAELPQYPGKGWTFRVVPPPPGGAAAAGVRTTAPPANPV